MRVITKSQEETEREGRRLGEYLKKSAVRTVLLYGDLGTGKTTFIKGIASAFGIPPREIGSASFVIVAEYDISPRFYHIDLYRIETAADLEELGIWEYLDSGDVAVIEWAERLSEAPEGALQVRIRAVDEHSREIVIDGEAEE